MPGRADDSLGDGVEAVAGWGWLVRLDQLQLLTQTPQTLYVYTPLYIYIYNICCIYTYIDTWLIASLVLTKILYNQTLVNIPEIFLQTNRPIPNWGPVPIRLVQLDASGSLRIGVWDLWCLVVLLSLGGGGWAPGGFGGTLPPSHLWFCSPPLFFQVNSEMMGTWTRRWMEKSILG